MGICLFVIHSILIGTNIGEKMAGCNVHCLYVVRSVDLSLCSPMIYAIFFIGKQEHIWQAKDFKGIYNDDYQDLYEIT